MLKSFCLAEIARSCGVPRGRIWRLRHGADCEDSFIETLAFAMYQHPDFLREVVQADRRRKGAA
jgi:hypothetical protein